MSSYYGEHLSVAKALFQLQFYLNVLRLGVTVQDLYASAYKRRRGNHYDDSWLTVLEENPEVQDSLDEPFTTQTIIETLMRTGHEPIVRALMKEVRNRHIEFTHTYLIGPSRRH